MLPTNPSAAVEPALTIWRAEGPVPDGLRRAVVAIGNFDGMHLGHRRLVDVARAAAAENGRPSAILTFDPHPRAFFQPGASLFRLTSEEVKFKIVAALGIDVVFVRRFDSALAGTAARSFVSDLLVGDLGASGLVVGGDFHFGKGREGTPEVLAQLAREHGLSCTIVSAVEAGDRNVSSSRIRAALGAGDIASAEALLGYRWFVRGEIVHGDKRGRLLGFPTANMRLEAGCGLRHGIYAVRIAIAPGIVRDGVASYGRRPTFDDGPPLLETYVFDFTGDLYGQVVEIEFVGWIRGEARFDTAEALVEQMDQDAIDARRRLADLGATQSLIG